MKHTILSIPAGEFKAKCLKLMEETKQKHTSFVITKHGKPIAKLIPFEEESFQPFGCLKGTVAIQEEIISPIDTHWTINDDE
jgi:prevent-host-death family protein